MRLITAVVLLPFLAGSSVLAGSVRFTPPEQTAPPGLVSVDLSLVTSVNGLVGIDSADIVIGSDLPIVSFTYLGNRGATFETVYNTVPLNIYSTDLYVGASSSTLIAPEMFPLLLGTLVLDASAASEGDYHVWVDTGLDTCSGLGATVLDDDVQRIVSEPLSGTAVIHIGGDVNLLPGHCGISLTRAHDNCLQLTFDGAISTPGAGDILIQQMQESGAHDPTDLSSSFTFSVEGGNVLKIAEGGDVLSNATWYSIRNTGGWGSVNPFKIDLRVVYGDVNGNGATTAADASKVWGNRGVASGACDPYDIDANGSITAADASGVWGFRGSSAPPKPSGHQCSP